MAKLQELPNVIYAAALGTSSAKTIWRTVVFAGAMLGSAACGGKAASSTTPEPTPTQQAEPAPAEEPAPAPIENATPAIAPAAGMASDPGTADPCAPAANPCAPAEKPVEDVTAKKDPAETKDKPKAKEKRPRATTESRPKGRGFVLS
jgi:hypothetical protein